VAKCSTFLLCWDALFKFFDSVDFRIFGEEQMPRILQEQSLSWNISELELENQMQIGEESITKFEDLHKKSYF